MLEAWLTAGPALELTEEAFDEHQDHPPTSKQAGVHLHPAVDAGPSSTPSGEHRASIRVARQSTGTGLAGDGDPGPGPRPRSIGGTDDGPRGLQDPRSGRLDGERGCCIRTGGFPPYGATIWMRDARQTR